MESLQVLRPADAGPVTSDVDGYYMSRMYPAYERWTAAQAVAANATAVHAAVADNGAEQVKTSGFTDLPCARTVTITPTGTAGHVKAVSHYIEGLDRNGQFQSETMPAFTVDSLTPVESTKAYIKITKHTMPAHDGTGVSFSMGIGNGLGLPIKCARNSVVAAWLGGARESTAPTVSASPSVLGSNVVKLSSALNGSEVGVALLVP